MISTGDVISYLEMCTEEGVNLQRGMNYHLKGGLSVILMSLRAGAPYADRIEDDGRTLIYEGHDAPLHRGSPDPKTVDQPAATPAGSPTQNGLFYSAARNCKSGKSEPELVKVYEKLHPGLWVFNGVFRLLDSWQERINTRKVFKFRLELADSDAPPSGAGAADLVHNRIIPASVKREVWKRDKGRCTICGSRDNLHFDHIIPYSRGGSSLVSENIQILCARHNLAKRDKIE